MSSINSSAKNYKKNQLTSERQSAVILISDLTVRIFHDFSDNIRSAKKIARGIEDRKKTRVFYKR
jgi:hypothetical protein